MMDNIAKTLGPAGTKLVHGKVAPPPSPNAFDKAAEAARTTNAPPPPSAPGSPPADVAPNKPAADDKRPPGDNRSAADIVNSDPTLKNLGNQSGVKDALKKQVGDFEHDPDAAFRAAEVLKYIKSSKTSGGMDRPKDITQNGKIEGFTKDGDARHGTEAGLLQDFGKRGYSALKDDHTLDKTSDDHVNSDGTNKNNDEVNIANLSSLIGNFFGSDGIDDSPSHRRDWLTAQLRDSVAKGDEARSVKLIKAGADPKVELSPGFTLLDHAARSNNSDTVRAILDAIPEGDRKAFVNQKAPDGSTALHGAADCGDKVAYQYLKDAGADDAGLKNDLIDLAKTDPTHLTYGKSALQELLGLPDASEIKDTTDRLRHDMTNELRESVTKGDEARSIALIRAGADPKADVNHDKSKSGGISLLMFAAGNNNSDTVKALLDAIPPDQRRAFVNQQNANGDTALEPVAQSPSGTSGRRGLVRVGVDGPGEARFDHRSPTTRIERWRTIFAHRNDVRLSCFRLT